MEVRAVERRFASYLEERSLSLHNIEPFLITYVELLFLFRDKLPQAALTVLLERQKQLRGEKFNGHAFDELKVSLRTEIDRDLRCNRSMTKQGMLNRMLLWVFLDTEESDLFYLTEPLFEFVEVMEVSQDQLKKILEATFIGFSTSN